jgi:hypothetical protein
MRMLKTGLALLLFSMPAWLTAQDSRFTVQPQFPKQGEKLSFSFDPAGTELEGAAAVEVAVYVNDKKGLHVEEMPLTKSGDKFTGSLQLGETATVVSFTFIAGDKKENNQKKGYIVQVYDDKQQPVQGSNKAMYQLYDYNSYVAGIERKPELAFSYIEKEYKAYPENFKENFSDYARGLANAKKDTYSEVLLPELQKFESQENLTEENYFLISNWYDRLKQKEKAEAITAKMKEKYPEGNWKKGEAYRAFANEKDIAKK